MKCCHYLVMSFSACVFVILPGGTCLYHSSLWEVTRVDLEYSKFEANLGYARHYLKAKSTFLRH